MPFLGTFGYFDGNLAFLGVRSSSKPVYIGTKGAFGNILELVRQKCMS